MGGSPVFFRSCALPPRGSWRDGEVKGSPPKGGRWRGALFPAKRPIISRPQGGIISRRQPTKILPLANKRLPTRSNHLKFLINFFLIFVAPQATLLSKFFTIYVSVQRDIRERNVSRLATRDSRESWQITDAQTITKAPTMISSQFSQLNAD